MSSAVTFFSKDLTSKSLQEINEGNVSDKTLVEINKLNSKDLSALHNFSKVKEKEYKLLTDYHKKMFSYLAKVSLCAPIIIALLGKIFTFVFATTFSAAIIGCFISSQVLLLAAMIYNGNKTNENFTKTANFERISNAKHIAVTSTDTDKSLKLKSSRYIRIALIMMLSYKGLSATTNSVNALKLIKVVYSAITIVGTITFLYALYKKNKV